MTVPERRTAARYTQLLCDLLQADGIDTSRLLRIAGIEAARLTKPDGYVTLSETIAFVAEAKRISGRTDLGFALGHVTSPTTHDLLGYGMLGCKNFDQLERLVSRHFHLLTEYFSMRYQRTPKAGVVTFTPLIAMPSDLLHFLLEHIAASHETVTRYVVPGPLLPYDIHVSMPAPPHLKSYQALAPVRFHFDEHALPGVRSVMPAELLDRPLPLANKHLVQQIEDRLTVQARRPLPDESGWGDYIAMMLRDALDEQPTLEQLARRLGVSTRTIVRHLAKEGLQFSDIADRVRYGRACEMLMGTEVSVTRIAHDLGFSNAANFSRAFKRVFATTPGEYRQRAGEAVRRAA